MGDWREADRSEKQREWSERQTGVQVCPSPVGLPDVDGLWVIDAVFLCHVIQEIKEEPDGNGRRTLRAEDRNEDVIHELLQRPLTRGREAEKEVERDR